MALLAFDTNRAEVLGVADLVENLHRREGIACPEILVLVHSDHDKHFSRPIREELARRGIASADPDAVKEMLADPQNRRAIAIYRLSANRADSLAWATLFKLAPGIGATFFRHIYDRAIRQVKGFGQVLLADYESGFEDASATLGNRASALVVEVLEWLDAHPLPDDAPEDGWGAWMLRDAADGVMPTVTDEFKALLLESTTRSSRVGRSALT